MSIKCFFRHGGDFLIDSVFFTLLEDKVSAIKYLFKLIAVVRRLLAYSGCRVIVVWLLDLLFERYLGTTLF